MHIISSTSKVTLETTLKVPWEDKESAAQWLRDSGYKDIETHCTEEYMRIVGHKTFVEEIKKERK